MNDLSEHKIGCPYCGEAIDVFVEFLEDEQQYIEDCQVCCRPIGFRVWRDVNGKPNVTVTHENE